MWPRPSFAFEGDAEELDAWKRFPMPGREPSAADIETLANKFRRYPDGSIRCAAVGWRGRRAIFCQGSVIKGAFCSSSKKPKVVARKRASPGGPDIVPEYMVQVRHLTSPLTRAPSGNNQLFHDRNIPSLPTPSLGESHKRSKM